MEGFQIRGTTRRRRRETQNIDDSNEHDRQRRRRNSTNMDNEEMASRVGNISQGEENTITDSGNEENVNLPNYQK